MPNENLTPQEGTAPTTPVPTQTPETPLVPPQVPTNTAMKMPEGVQVMPKEKTPYLAIILGALIVLVALGLGGLYIMGTMLAENGAAEQAADITEDSTPETPAVAETDSIESIEADLEGENFESIDAELQAIDAEIEGSATTTP